MQNKISDEAKKMLADPELRKTMHEYICEHGTMAGFKHDDIIITDGKKYKELIFPLLWLDLCQSIYDEWFDYSDVSESHTIDRGETKTKNEG